MTMLGSGGTKIGLKPLCWVLKPKTAVRCTRLDPDHDGDHANEYAGQGGVTWARAEEGAK
ncbi:hypothetical protein OG292_03360 [Streptomyces sp. NBC_01511]|uniref:hypothetical protein n=1 Tax=Streptomyces sp. NBC_01511 TaxID=2903889 RepID=UPI0038647D12